MSADPVSAPAPAGSNGAPEAPTEKLTPGAEAHAAAARAEAAAARAEQAAQAAASGGGAGGGAPPAGGASVPPPGGGQPPPIFMLQGQGGQPLFAIPQLAQLPAGGASQPPPASGARKRDWTFWVPVTILGILAACGLLAGVFFVGWATRPSDQDIAARVSRAVSAAQARGDAGRRSALSAQRELLAARANARVRRAHAAGYQAGKDAGYNEGQSAGYSSGQAAGRQAGYNEGHSAGYSEGSRQGFLQGLQVVPPAP